MKFRHDQKRRGVRSPHDGYAPYLSAADVLRASLLSIDAEDRKAAGVGQREDHRERLLLHLLRNAEVEFSGDPGTPAQRLTEPAGDDVADQEYPF
jgi:hypothetical protein